MLSDAFKASLEDVMQHVNARRFGLGVEVAVSYVRKAETANRENSPGILTEIRSLELIVVFAILENVKASVYELPPPSPKGPLAAHVAQLNAAIDELSVADQLSVTPIDQMPLLNVQRTLLRLQLVKLVAWTRAAQGKNVSALAAWNLAVEIACGIGAIDELPSLHLNASACCLRLSVTRAQDALTHAHKAYLSTVAILGSIRTQLNNAQGQASEEEKSDYMDVCVLAVNVAGKGIFDERATEVRQSLVCFLASVLRGDEDDTSAAVSASHRSNPNPGTTSPNQRSVSSRRNQPPAPATKLRFPWYSTPTGISPEEAMDFTVEIKESAEASILPMRYLEWATSDRRNTPKRLPFLQLVLQTEEDTNEAEGRSLQDHLVGQVRKWGGVLALCYRTTGRCLEALDDEGAALASYAAGSSTAKQCLGTPHAITSACEEAHKAAMTDATHRGLTHSPPKLTRERTRLQPTTTTAPVKPVFNNVSVPKYGRRILRPQWNMYFNSQAPPLYIPDDVLLRYHSAKEQKEQAEREATVAMGSKRAVTTLGQSMRSVYGMDRVGESPVCDASSPSHTNRTNPDVDAITFSTMKDTDAPPPKLKKKTFNHMKHVYRLKFDPDLYDIRYCDRRDDRSFHKRDNEVAREKRAAERKKERSEFLSQEEQREREKEKEDAPGVTNDHQAVFDGILTGSS